MPSSFRPRSAAVSVVAAIGLLTSCSSSTDTASPTSTAAPSGASGSSSAGTGTAIPSGVTHAELESGGRTRSYRLFVPEGITASDKVPLVIGLHGGLGTGDQFAATTDFDSVATKHKFIVAYPNGAAIETARGRRQIQTWNAGLCCGPSVTEKVDDVGFLAALIDSLEAKLPIDANKVGMIGHSNGAMMTWRFACERFDKISAGVMVAGALEVDRLADCAPKEGVDLENIHGSADANVPIAGGKDQGISGVSYRSQADSLDAWTAAEQCGSPGKVETTGPLSRQRWNGCRDDTVMVNLVVAGAEHPWPGSPTTGRGAGLAGTPSQDLDASDEAWGFLSQSFDR